MEKEAISTSAICSQFINWKRRQKISFLTVFSHELTVCARAFYTSPESSEKMICINELVHITTGQLIKIIAQDHNRYPDNIFFDIIVSYAQERGIKDSLIIALN